MKSLSPVLYRYVRPYDYVYNYYKQGDEKIAKTTLSSLPHEGVTYAIQIDYEKNQLIIGYSVCSKKENFNKSIGRQIAEQRLKESPIVFDFKMESDDLLVDVISRELNEKFYKDMIFTKENKHLINFYEDAYYNSYNI